MKVRGDTYTIKISPSPNHFKMVGYVQVQKWNGLLGVLIKHINGVMVWGTPIPL